jgi:hypothetical protein
VCVLGGGVSDGVCKVTSHQARVIKSKKPTPPRQRVIPISSGGSMRMEARLEGFGTGSQEEIEEKEENHHRSPAPRDSNDEVVR